MERSTLDQATDLLLRDNRLLLLVPEHASTDALASMVALSMALEQLGKEVTMVCASHVPPSLQFLPGTSQVHDYLERTRDYVLTIPLGGVRPANVEWEVLEKETLRFVITPEKGKQFPDGTPMVERGQYEWDSIIVVGSPDFHRLGKPFREHASFFYNTPTLNIDRGTNNEFFGEVNLVSATAGTIAEVVFDLLDRLGGVHLLTQEVSTCLFAAILAGTHAFQTPNTTPRTFSVAATLLEQDADRQTVTRHLFKTHTLPELRLVGRSLSRLKELRENIYGSIVSQNDFLQSGATTDDLPAVLHEIVERTGERSPVILAFERTPGHLEALFFPGRLSTDDQEELREKTHGTLAGPFFLVSLGEHDIKDGEDVVRTHLLPHLPLQETE